jgi:exodeoxyribonuclease VII large subunit
MSAERQEILTVAQLTRKVKGLIEGQIGKVWVGGEISNFRVSPAGHSYFTLKDKDSQLDAVMFRGRLKKLGFDPDSGMDVVVFGMVSVYEKRGSYQIVCEEMHPKGVGALQLAFDKLKLKLQEEGLFDEENKKPLPMLPQRIGIVTSPTGAAIRDMLNVINRRFANVHVVLYPARVQGEEAAPEIIDGIRALEAYGVDVMIIGRGGGSLEDLWPFNEESVVRAVFETKTPIISAVGHEIDFALTDFAADVRAPTPSAAAELVVQERAALDKRVQQLSERLAKASARKIEQGRNRLQLAHASYVFQRPEELVRQRRQQADELRMRLHDHMEDAVSEARQRLDQAIRAHGLLSPARRVAEAKQRLARSQIELERAATGAVSQARNRLAPVMAQLDALSPLAVLNRGYAIAYNADKTVVRDAATLKTDDEVTLRFGKGGVKARVEEVNDE